MEWDFQRRGEDGMLNADDLVLWGESEGDLRVVLGKGGSVCDVRKDGRYLEHV